jgi:PAS domain S-box-containing protein
VKPSVGNGRIADLDDLNHRRAFLAAALSSIPDQVYTVDRNRKLTYANAAAIELVGESEAGVIGKRFEQLGFPPDVAGKLNAGFDAVFSTGREVRDEILLAAGAGPGNYYQFVWTPICNEDGVVEFVIGVSRDTTAQRRLEDRLSESESRFRAVTELAPALLWETDPPGSHVALNARWLEYTGQAHPQTQQFGWLDAIHPDDRPASEAVFRGAHRSGLPLEVRHRIRRVDGVYRWFSVRQIPIVDEDANVLRWLGAATDIHEQRVDLDEVERRVESRTRERDELRRQLVAADESQRRHLARELHDRLGQQMTGLSLGLDRVQRLADEREYAGSTALRQRLTELRDLTAEMFKAVRYVALELRAPELDDMGLQSAVETYVREWASRYGIPAYFAGPSSQLALPMDVASTMYRILQEALTNIAKHARANKVEVTIGTADAGITLCVEDDGSGFEFEAARSRAKADRRLGLASIQERVSLVDGTFRVDSHPGDGARLFVWLPTAERIDDER